jgi:hypothetical protein
MTKELRIVLKIAAAVGLTVLLLVYAKPGVDFVYTRF